MKLTAFLANALFATSSFAAVVKREQFSQGQPIDDRGKGAPILGSNAPGPTSSYMKPFKSSHIHTYKC